MKEISKEQSTVVADKILEFAQGVIAKNGLTKGRVKITYGIRFSLKFEAHNPSSDVLGVSSKLCRDMSRQITDFAKEVFGQELELKKVNSKYGDLYSITITAEPVELGKNGVNLASSEATDLKWSLPRYGASQMDSESVLGSEATINGKTYILIGLKSGRNEIKLVVKTHDGTEYLVPERFITHWGLTAPQVIGASV
jgi:hypothetical protein